MMVFHMCAFLSSVEQIQLDFVEMLRVRDEKRRMRHVETLRRQKEEGDDEAVASGGGGGGGEARVELLGDVDEEQERVSSSVKATSEPQPVLETASHSHRSSSSTSSTNRQVRLQSRCSGHVYHEVARTLINTKHKAHQRLVGT